jgi:hypothetical protein
LPSPGSGAVDVVVQGTCGASAISPSDKFTYTAGSGSATVGFSGDTLSFHPMAMMQTPARLRHRAAAQRRPPLPVPPFRAR